MDYKSDTIMTCMEVVWKNSVWEKENNMPITGRAGQEQKENTDRAGVWNSQTFCGQISVFYHLYHMECGAPLWTAAHRLRREHENFPGEAGFKKG